MAAEGRLSFSPEAYSSSVRIPRSGERASVIVDGKLTAWTNDQPSFLPRLLVFALLVAAASLDTGPSHGRAHWLILAVYGR